MHAEILANDVLSHDYHVLRRIKYARLDKKGARQAVSREVFERGQASAILLWHRVRDALVFVRQFRLPVELLGDEGMMLEVAAGGIDGVESPLDAALRECREETGYEPLSAVAACVIHPSPAAVKERLFLFFAEVDDQHRTSEGGGLEAESEDVEVVELPVETIRAMLAGGEITDAKTLVLLYWYFARRQGQAEV